MYTLKDYNNEPIIGSFYQSELQRIRTNENTVYKIEKVLRRRVRNGKTELFVKWLGWSDKFCSWILESQAKDV